MTKNGSRQEEKVDLRVIAFSTNEEEERISRRVIAKAFTDAAEMQDEMIRRARGES